jgi:hypothetical protein
MIVASIRSIGVRGFFDASGLDGSMSVSSDRRLRWLSVAVVLVTLLTVGVAGVGVVAVLSAITSAAAGESVLLAVLQVAIPFLLAFAALSVLGVALLTWVVVRAVRLVQLPRSDRLATVARGVERWVPGLEDGAVSEHVTPTAADRRDALVERYANDELTEREFERELEALLREHGDPDADWPVRDGEDPFDRELANELAAEDDASDREPGVELAGEESDRDCDEAFSAERERR